MTSTGLPATMRAVGVKGGKGGASSLKLDEAVPLPELKTGHVLVKVRAAGVNRMDILQREGQYPLPPGASSIIGVEFSGTVAAVAEPESGEAAPKQFSVGDEVFGLATGGAYAEYITVPAKMVLEKPKELSWEEAASIPENFFTAYQALRLLADLQKGEDVLVHAGASGVGLAAIQLARSFGARNIYATAGTDDKCRHCEQTGATKAFNYKTSDWAEQLKASTDGKGVNIIMDFIGATYFQKNVNSLTLDGRLVLQGFMGGVQVEKFNMAPLLMKRLKVIGSTLRSRSLAYQCDLVQGFVKSGALKSIVQGATTKGEGHHEITIHKVYPWSQVREAHEEMEANKNTGKIVLVIE